MYASTSQFEDFETSSVRSPHQRVDAAAAVSLKHDGRSTRLDRLFQQGSAKIRFPKNHHDQTEAVLINTAGGLTGGDRLSWDVDLSPDCSAVVTTQACEKSYRSASGAARVQTSLRLQANSILHWLPQETILYEGSQLARTFDVEIGENAELLALESVMLGREAMGEKIETVQFHDRWRVSRNGRLIFADDLRLSDNEKTISKLNGNLALASLLFVSPQDEECLLKIVQKLRDAYHNTVSGFSAFDGKITGRILASGTYELRQALVPVMRLLRDADLPRVWRI